MAFILLSLLQPIDGVTLRKNCTILNARINVNEIAIKNAIGETSVSAKAVLKSNPEISYPIVKGAFTPLYAGTYDVIYSISDYNEKAESSYSVEVKAHDNIVWQTKLELGTYYLANFDYTLPDVKAFTFGDGTPKEVAITVTATDSAKDKVELENRAFKPQTSGEYTITYKAENAGKTISQTAITTCVDVGVGEKLRVEDYFIGENIQKSLTGNAVILITKTNTSVRFINPICSRTVSMDLSVVKESGDHFDSFDVVLTDATDATKSITMNFAKNGTDNGTFSVSGGRSIKTSEDFYSNGTLVFKFDNIARTAQLGVNQAIAITKTDDGENFEGFRGENVYVDIRFNGVIETAKIRVHRIGNQTLYQDCGDTNAPDIYYAGFGDGDQKIGDIVTLDRIYVADVVCPGVKVEYYVKHQNGKYAKDVNGIELSAQNTDYTQKYQIEMTEYGRYTVTMRVTDLFGNSAAYTYNFSCVNLQSVKIEILDDQSESAKLGETVTIKSFQVPNFEMDELVVRIFIKDPEGVMKQVIDNVFVPDLRGEYVVSYYVTDVDGNMDMASYAVKVS